METQLEFNIKIKRNIPYLSKGLLWIFIFFLITLFIGNILFLPSEHALQEMKFTYWILAIPDSINEIFAYSLIGTLIAGSIYYFAKFSETGKIVFNEKRIVIHTQKVYKEFEFKIFVNFILMI